MGARWSCVRALQTCIALALLRGIVAGATTPGELRRASPWGSATAARSCAPANWEGRVSALRGGSFEAHEGCSCAACILGEGLTTMRLRYFGGVGLEEGLDAEGVERGEALLAQWKADKRAKEELEGRGDAGNSAGKDEARREDEKRREDERRREVHL
ncbi:hypothetical protein T484DRAFT_1830345 [Baffinella frigidus]|nr:hypothetical protein T484DRAFT_1830345 [Cryptophyta sp. CCMP2293]